MDALEELIELQKLGIPEGFRIYLEKTVTYTWTFDLIKDYPFRTLLSIDVVNKGPDDAWISVNGGKEIPIEAYEVLPTIDFRKPQIKRIDLRVETGKQARVKIYGLY